VLPYHAGELEVQARTGQFAEATRNAAVVRSVLPPPLIRFLPSLPWIVLGAADPSGAVWATALFGLPGFVRSPGCSPSRERPVTRTPARRSWPCWRSTRRVGSGPGSTAASIATRVASP
jgi:hypothetical protein